MQLFDKTLLLMGGGAYAKGIKAYKDKHGFRIVALGKDANNPIARIADVSYTVDTQNVDRIVEIVKKEKVDGIFVGSSEVNISPAIDVAEKTGARFYVNRKQWDIVANKARFKEFARKSGFPVIPEFKLSSNPTPEEIEKLVFPVMIKPVDSSGARGLNPCYSKESFKDLFDEAMKWSPRKEVIVESLITDAEDICVCYSIQNGESILSYSFTKDVVRSQNNYVSLPIFHLYPSRFLNQYCEEADLAARNMLHEMGLMNGTINLQGFYKDGRFFFYEAGYRMGGAQAYILTEYMNGANVLHYMINYVLTGEMCDQQIAGIEDAHFPYPCCNYYVELKAGTIDHIDGIDEVERMPGVLNITQMCHEGDVILETNEIGRAIYRIHVVGEDMESLAQRLVDISRTLRIWSTKGEEMQIEHLEFDRCLQTINNKIIV